MNKISIEEPLLWFWVSFDSSRSLSTWEEEVETGRRFKRLDIVSAPSIFTWVLALCFLHHKTNSEVRRLVKTPESKLIDYSGHDNGTTSDLLSRLALEVLCFEKRITVIGRIHLSGQEEGPRKDWLADNVTHWQMFTSAIITGSGRRREETFMAYWKNLRSNGGKLLRTRPKRANLEKKKKELV